MKRILDKLKKEKKGMSNIINPIVEKYDLEKKELLELCQVGKFVYKLNSDISIVDKPQPPYSDFIIRNGTELIGLEHTRIFTPDAKRYLKILTLIEYSQNIYKEKYPRDKVHAIISINKEEFDYKISEKFKLAYLIVNLVHDKKSGLQPVLPSFITEIKTTIHSGISFSYKENDTNSIYLTKDRLIQEIRKKERKIEGYKKSQLIMSEYWLILFIDSVSSVSYQLDENENYEADSKFNRVYLMTDFDASIIRVK